MKRPIIILGIITVICLITVLLVKPVIKQLVKQQLETVFLSSQVSLGGCVFEPTPGVILTDIKISRQGLYQLKIKQAAARYHFSSILKKGSLELSLNGVTFSLNTPKQDLNQFSQYLHLSPGGGGPALLKSAKISKVSVDLNTQDLSAQAELSAEIDLAGLSLNYLELKMASLKMAGVQLEKLNLQLGPDVQEGKFDIALLKYDKLSVTDIKGQAGLSGRELSLDRVSARALAGSISGDLSLSIDAGARYLVGLKCVDLDIEQFVRDFKLQEKFDMTGKLSGEAQLKGNGAQIEILGGSFSTLSPGGILVIKDAKLLRNIAGSSNQPLDLLVESFKNYRYNTGVISLGLSGSDISLLIALEGEAGKRDLNLILHDFKL